MWFDPANLKKTQPRATAIFATLATSPSSKPLEAPKIAKVAKVATPAPASLEGEAVPATITQLGQNCWLVRFPDSTTKVLAIDPPVNREWVQSQYPDATVEPYDPPTQSQGPLTPEQSLSIRQWLAHIGERDQATINQVLAHCQRDADAFRYFMRRAIETRT